MSIEYDHDATLRQPQAATTSALDALFAESALVPGCRDEPTLFFPPDDDQPKVTSRVVEDRIEVAKDICYDCVFMQACHERALRHEEPWGVWGGEWFHLGSPSHYVRRGKPSRVSAVERNRVYPAGFEPVVLDDLDDPESRESDAA